MLSVPSTLSGMESNSSNDELDNERSGSGDDDIGIDSNCKTYFETNASNDMKALFAMAVGLTTTVKDKDGKDIKKPFVNLNKEPYASSNRKHHFAPNGHVMRSEIVHRANLMKINPLPCPKGWKSTQQMDWLNEHPIKDKTDIAFIKQEIDGYSKLLEEAGGNKKKGEATDDSSKPWVGNEPYLYLYDLLCDESIMPLFVDKDKCLNHQQLDAHNSLLALPDVWEKAAKLFNSPMFEPMMNVYLDSHDAFKTSIPLLYNDAPVPTTAVKLKAKFTDSRAKLVQVKDKWDRSGNGEGAIDDSGDLIACDKQNFLGRYKEHVLYLWALFEEEGEQMLTVACQMATDDVAADDDNAPSMFRRNRKHELPLDGSLDEHVH